MSNKEHYKNIFAWIGLIDILHRGTKEEIEDLDDLREMLFDALVVAKSYKGDNKQITEGYNQMILTIPQLEAFYPGLQAKLS